MSSLSGIKRYGCSGLMENKWRKTLCLIVLLTVVVLSVTYNTLLTNRYKYYNPYILETLPETSKRIYQSLSSGNHMESLKSDVPFITVHYLWCVLDSQNLFGFKHYLSILSILKRLRPDQIVFHYAQYPISKNHLVNWLKDLQRDIAILTFKPMSDKDLCGGSFLENSQSMNGVFILDNDIIIADLDRAMAVSKLASCSKNNERGCVSVSLRPPVKKLILTAVPLQIQNFGTILCPQINAVDTDSGIMLCVRGPEAYTSEDVLQGVAYFQKLSRLILFNDESLVVTDFSSKLIPLQGHIIAEKLTFRTYSSINSAVTFGGIKTVYFHSNGVPKNQWWDQLQDMDAHIHYVEVDSKWFPTAPSDVIQYGLYILLQYGGILFNEHVIWQKLVPLEIREFDSVGTRTKYEHNDDANGLTFDVLMAKPGAKFIQSLLPLVQQLGSQSDGKLMELAAYHIYELEPNTIYLHFNLLAVLSCDRVSCSLQPGTHSIQDVMAVVINNTGIHAEFDLHKLKRSIYLNKSFLETN